MHCEQVNSLFKSNRRNATKLHNKIKSGEEVLLKDGFYKHPSDLEFKQNCSYDLGASGSMIDIDSLPLYPCCY